MPSRSRSTPLKPLPTFNLPSLLKTHKLSSRSRSILPLSSGDSSASEQDTLEEESESEIDSEEEEWPVAPPTNRGFGLFNAAKGKGKGKASHIFQVGEKDEVEKWNDQEKSQSWVSFLTPFFLLTNTDESPLAETCKFLCGA